MNKKKKQVTSVIVATAFTLTTVINAAPTVVYAHEANKQIELDMYGNTSTDIILNNNTEDTSVNEETIPEIESVITDNLDNTDEVISSDRISYNTTWVEGKELSSDLKVDPGVTLTINAKVTIKGTVTISGGGTIKRGSNYTEELISVPKDSSLTLENITLDGGADYSGEINSTLNRGTENKGINANGALVHSSGSLVINNGTKLENNFWEDKTKGSAAVYVEAGTTTINGGSICNNYGGASGAGVYVASKGTLNLEGGTIFHNNSSAGAGVYVASNGTLNLKNGTICNNYATGGGAGIYTCGKLNMTGGECSDNKVTGIGGGIRITSTGNVNISGGSISNNSASGTGGGIYQYGGRLEVSGGEISHNKAEGGGAIFVQNSRNTLTISNAKIHNNYASVVGGGIRLCEGCKLDIKGGEIHGNTSEGSGGGIYAYKTEVFLQKVSITNNSIKSGNGGGVWIGNSGKLGLDEVTIKDNKLIKSDNSTYDDIAISGIRIVDLSCADDSSEVHFSFFNGPIVFKPLGSKTLSISTLKKMSYRSNSGEENYQMWFNSDDGKIYATKIVTNGGEIPFPTDYDENRLAEPIKDGHIFIGWYDNETGSQLTTKPEHTKTYYAKWEKIPTGLTSLTGMKLSEVTLPKGDLGEWSWVDGDRLVNNEGTCKYQAKFTPSDQNYKELIVEIEVKVEIGWTIENGVPGKDWKYKDGVFTFIKNGDYVIDGKNIQTGDSINVSENFKGTITLRNVKISAPKYAMVIENGAELTLIVEGKNELGGTNRSARIKSNNATTGRLIIDSKKDGSLKIVGQNDGIGEINSAIKTNNIEITGGNVTGNITGDVNISGGSLTGNIGGNVTINKGGNFNGNIQGEAIITGGNVLIDKIDGKATIDGGNVLIKDSTKAIIQNSDGKELVPVEIPLTNSKVEKVEKVEVNGNDFNISGSVNDKLTIYVPIGDDDKKHEIIIVDSEKNKTDVEVIVTTDEEPVAKIQNRWITNPSIESILYGNNLNPQAVPFIGTVEFQYSTTQNGEYSTSEPKEVGTYWMKAVVAEVENFTGLESAPIKFKIKEVSQWIVEEPSQPELEEPSPIEPEESIDAVLNLKSNTIAVGDKVTLNLKNIPKNASCTWSSSNKKVATVNAKGIVTGKKKGVATITCTVKVDNETKKLTAKINVLQLKKEIKTRTVIAGKKITLKVENYKNATCTWSSSNKKVAIVNSKGVVTGLKAGETTIRCKVDGPTKSCFVQYKVKVNTEKKVVN